MGKQTLKKKKKVAIFAVITHYPFKLPVDKKPRS